MFSVKFSLFLFILKGMVNSHSTQQQNVYKTNILFSFELILPYTNVFIALYTPSVCGKYFTGDSGGIRTHDLLLTNADVLTSRPPSRISPESPVKYFPQTLGKHRVYSAIHTSV